MKQFTDKHGADWEISITAGSIKRVRGLIGVDLYKPGEGEPPLLVRLHEPALFCDVLYAVCQPEAKRRGVTSEQFGEGLAGDTILEARKAFFDEYQDFFLGLGAPVEAASLARVREFFDRVIATGAEAVAALLTPNDSSTASQASSA